MAVPRPLLFLGKAALVAALLVPPGAIWLSGRFGEDASRDPQPAAPAPLATLPRSETTVVPASRPAPAGDAVPAPAPPVTVDAGAVTAPRPAPGSAPVPAPRGGQLQGGPEGLPDPNRSEATPR